MKTRIEKLAKGVTLYLGDCRDILPTLVPVDMIFTDPPYGHNNNNGDLIHRRERFLGLDKKAKALGKSSKTEPPRPIKNDGPKEAKLLTDWFFAQAPSLLVKGGCCCCCGGGGGPDPTFARWTLELGKHLDFKHMVVWDKGPMGMGQHYRRSYEVILIGQKKGAPGHWFDTSCKIENIIRPATLTRKIIPRITDHPTPKPPELAKFFIRLHTKSGHTVLDPFMGAGSTGLAAVQLQRNFIGIEIEPKFFDIACRRLSKELSGFLYDHGEEKHATQRPSI